MSTLYSANKIFAPLHSLRRLISRKTLTRLRFLFGIIAGITFVGAVLSNISPLLGSPWLWYGGFLLSLGLYLEQMMLYSYDNYWYFSGLRGEDTHDRKEISYDVARIIHSDSFDITRAFFAHPVGRATLLRTGISREDWQVFIEDNQRNYLAAQDITITETPITVETLGYTILLQDTSLRQFLEEKGISPAHLRGALRWMANQYIQTKIEERWWSQEVLLRGVGFGRSWSFGYTRLLNEYTKSVHTSAVFSIFHTIPQYAREKVTDVKEILLHEKAGNVLILGEAGVGKMDVVVALENQIERNESVPGLQHKKIAILDTERIFANSENETDLEQLLLSILNEATEAGNTILVIESLSSFIQTTQSRGVQAEQILDDYLAHPNIQFIATDTPHEFHTHIQPIGVLMRRFGQVVIDTPETDTVVRILSRSCNDIEKTHDVFFTHPALIAIAQGAKRYITDGVPPDSALTLLVEIASRYQGQTITDSRVAEYLTDKTGIPSGEVTSEERDVLLGLEDTLHEHVIGQDVAIKAIADTIRRSRIGVQSSNRPIGSFLFLGPTGVGKTETAKTLAQVFFGSQEEMLRFDMSEYSQNDALIRLIGTEEDAGDLSEALHKKPYTVLLLDEFEKANSAVHDLFLQILDEGRFTNGRGVVVNARNTIIIATSNAGANLIYKTATQRREQPVLNQDIIDHVIENGFFRPELINRFDNTIIFEPLNETEQQNVAKIMLRELETRMQAKGYRLKINPDVPAYLARTGYSATFGGRAMRRVIQNTVESILAEKILAERLSKGDQIELSSSDLEKYMQTKD